MTNSVMQSMTDSPSNSAIEHSPRVHDERGFTVALIVLYPVFLGLVLINRLVRGVNAAAGDAVAQRASIWTDAMVLARSTIAVSFQQ